MFEMKCNLSEDDMGLRELVFILVLGAVTGDGCYDPLQLVGDKCLYISNETLNWNEARAFCVESSWLNPDLIAFDNCDDFVDFAGFLGFLVPPGSSLWIGAHTEFTGNNWRWITGEPLPSGVPFWAPTEGHDDGEECAAMEADHYLRLADHDCQDKRRFVCISQQIPDPEFGLKRATVELTCPAFTIQIGSSCFYFSTESESWEESDVRCKSLFPGGGNLFSPSSCEEFAKIAHHLEAKGAFESHWVGAVDVTGNQEWYWINGDFIPSGPPFWASEEPNHDISSPRSHGAVMSATKRFYLEDEPVGENHLYICKVEAVIEESVDSSS